MDEFEKWWQEWTLAEFNGKDLLNPYLPVIKLAAQAGWGAGVVHGVSITMKAVRDSVLEQLKGRCVK